MPPLAGHSPFKLCAGIVEGSVGADINEFAHNAAIVVVPANTGHTGNSLNGTRAAGIYHHHYRAILRLEHPGDYGTFIKRFVCANPVVLNHKCRAAAFMCKIFFIVSACKLQHGRLTIYCVFLRYCLERVAWMIFTVIYPAHAYGFSCVYALIFCVHKLRKIFEIAAVNGVRNLHYFLAVLHDSYNLAVTYLKIRPA